MRARPSRSAAGSAGRRRRLPVVALVASAGGLDALAEVLGPLPADLPAAVLVAQHLDPYRTSHLTSILAGQTALRVAEAADGDELVPGVVLVAPAARHLLLMPESRIGLVRVGALPPAAVGTGLVHAVLPLPGIAAAAVVVGRVASVAEGNPAFSLPGGGYPQ